MIFNLAFPLHQIKCFLIFRFLVFVLLTQVPWQGLAQIHIKSFLYSFPSLFLKIQIPKLFTFGFFSTSTSYSGKILNVPILFIITLSQVFCLSINKVKSAGTLKGSGELSLPMALFLGITYKPHRSFQDRKSLLWLSFSTYWIKIWRCMAEN